MVSIVPRDPDGLFDDGSVALWLQRPNLIFTQVRALRYTVNHVHTFTGPIMNLVRGRLGATSYVWVSDSRQVRHYESGARLLLTDWGRSARDELARILIVVSPANRLMVMGAHVGAAAAAVVGIRMTVLTSVEALGGEAIQWPGVEPPPDGPPPKSDPLRQA